jgi:predicted dehydrogenase
METIEIRDPATPARAGIPRLGFLGVGWIGRNRLEAVISSGGAEVVGICDSSSGAVDVALAAAGGSCARAGSLEELLSLGLDGLVIATPSALHAEQATHALERGVAVFCQKPLGRDAEETGRVVGAARAADRLLCVDLSYRHTAAMTAIRDLLRRGELGRVFAVDLVFHNAYGPDKPWFYDRSLSGGGCVVDLGTHLVDLALWCLGFPPVEAVGAALYAAGKRLGPGSPEVEDYATAAIDLADGTRVTLACSWRLAAGRDAVIEASFHGTSGGASMRNIDGSFHDFTAERYRGTSRETIAAPPDAWGGRAAVDWTRRLARGERFDPAASRLVEVAAALDGIYGR